MLLARQHAVRKGPEADVEAHTACGSFDPGHLLHWTQWKRAAAANCLPVSRVVQDGTTLEVVFADHATLRWVHHDPEGLRAALAASREPVIASPEHRALRVDGFWFNCAPEGAAFTPCR